MATQAAGCASARGERREASAASSSARQNVRDHNKKSAKKNPQPLTTATPRGASSFVVKPSHMSHVT